MVRTHVLYCTLAASAVALGAAAGQAGAAPLLGVDFDTTEASNAYAYSYTEQGASIGHAHNVAPGNGVDGSAALRATVDASNASSYWGTAFVIEQKAQPPFTVDALSDLYYAFATAVEGGQSTATNLRVTIRFHDGSTLLQLRDNVSFDTTIDGFQAVSANLADLTVQSGSFEDLLATTDEVTVRLSAEFNSGSGGFGFDAGNAMAIDNIVVDVVPEPASLALLTLGGLGLLRRRR